MKKLLSVLLVVVLMLSMVACGGNADNKDADKNADDAVVTAKVIDIELTQEEYAFGVDKTQPELLTQVNDFIKKIMEDGTFETICEQLEKHPVHHTITGVMLEDYLHKIKHSILMI